MSPDIIQAVPPETILIVARDAKDEGVDIVWNPDWILRCSVNPVDFNSTLEHMQTIINCFRHAVTTTQKQLKPGVSN